MNCEEMVQMMVDSWDQTLEPERDALLRRHLESCPDCATDAADLKETWQRLGALGDVPALDAPVPSDRMRARFYTSLAEIERRPERSWRSGIAGVLDSLRPRPVVWQLASTLAVGLVLGLLVSGRNGTQDELGKLRTEMESMSRVVTLSLLDHPSASERLRAVGWSARSAADSQVLDALLDTVKHDRSVNVRLAAVEALASRSQEPYVRSQLVETLSQQPSPLVQMQLVETLLRGASPDVRAGLRRVLQSEELNEDVRQRILEATSEQV